MLLCLTLVCAGGCKPAARGFPESDYQESVQLLRRGDLKGALAKTDAALRQFPDPNSDAAWKFNVLKAEIYVWQGRFKDSLALLQPELSPSLAKSDTAIWRFLTKSSVYTALSQFEEADKCLHSAESLALANRSELLGQVFLRQGTLTDYRNDYSGAAALYRKALQFSVDHKDSYLEASALGSLGILATEQEHYDESIDWDKRALQVAEAASAQSLAAIIHVNMGWSYFEVGDYEQALMLFQQAQQSSGKAGLLRIQLISRINAGAVELFLHEYQRAQQDSELALDLSRKLEHKELTTQSLNTLSGTALERGQLDAAENYNREALEVSQSAHYHPGEVSSLLIQGRTEFGRGHYKQAQESLTKVIADPSAGTALHWEAEARLAKVYAAEGLFERAEKEYRHSIETIQAARLSIDRDELRLSFLSSAIDFFDDYIDFLVSRGRMEDALNVADQTRAATLAEGLSPSAAKNSKAPRNLQPRQIAQRLQATLLTYWLGQKQSYLWVISPAKITCIHLPKKSEIEPSVKSYREKILRGGDVLATGSGEGQQLFSTLVAPAEKFLAKNSRVVLLPDESLYGLNFETLIVPGPAPHYWIEDVTLSTASSLTLLSNSYARRPSPTKSILLIGNPRSPDSEFPPLTQASNEMRRITERFPDGRREVLEGNRATASAYLASSPDRFAYLHFVTHGIASHIRPLESAVILTREGDSYKLYARDIVKRPLNAELVTISACNGAGTRAYAGEGLVGLSWAFLRAGAHNVVGALWEVSDSTSTPQLMDNMYDHLNRGEEPAVALRNAKLSILHANSQTVFSKPFYWAPFQLYSGS